MRYSIALHGLVDRRCGFHGPGDSVLSIFNVTEWQDLAFSADDEKWMREAIKVARSKGARPEDSSLGSVIIWNGRLIAAERDQTELLPDATAHAEILAIRRG